MRTFLLLMLLSISGCSPALKLYYGYHDPKPEDKESLTKYLNKKGINADNILVFKDSMSLFRRMKEINDFPSIRVFNKGGILVYYKDTSILCNSPAYEFTDSICSRINLRTNASKTITSELKGLLSLENQKIDVKTDDQYDYYVFIYWCRFEGRLNKSHVKVWENNLQTVKGCRVKIYKVDLDLQKTWYKQ